MENLAPIDANADLPTKKYVDDQQTAHVAAADPHTGYQLESERGAVNGYASLDAGGKVPTAQLPAIGGTTEVYAQPDAPVIVGTDLLWVDIDDTSVSTGGGDGTTKEYVDSRIWTGTQAEYDAISTKDSTVLYVVT